MQESFKIFDWLVKPQTNELVGAAQTLKLDHKVMQLLETRVGLRFLIVAGIIVLFLLVLLTRKHFH